MAIRFSLRYLTVPGVALAAVLAAGCQSTTPMSSADHTSRMGAAAVPGTAGPGTVKPSGTTGPSGSGTSTTGSTGSTTR